MQNYVNLLIQDIKASQKRKRPPKKILSPELESVRGAEQYLYGDQYEIGNLFGLEKKQFPPVEKLTDEQIQSITNELSKLWSVFNLIPEFPENMAAKYKYQIFIEYLDHKTSYTSVGNIHIEFCDYDPDSCPFPDDYCACKAYKLES
jgi:hypothetical protein